MNPMIQQILRQIMNRTGKRVVGQIVTRLTAALGAAGLSGAAGSAAGAAGKGWMLNFGNFSYNFDQKGFAFKQ